jgi:hypothetical protein
VDKEEKPFIWDGGGEKLSSNSQIIRYRVYEMINA